MNLFPKVITIYFHQISPDDFEHSLKWFIKHHYRFISTDELYQWHSGRLCFKEKVCHISFDDGKRSNLTLVPIIEKYNVPVTVFVATEALHTGNYWWEFVREKYGHFEQFKRRPYDDFIKELSELKVLYTPSRTAMTVDELQEFAKNDLVTIGSHTVTHPILTSVPDDVLEYELKASKEELEKLLGTTIDVFSYPNGNLRKREVELARNYYKMAFTTQSKYPRLSDDLMLVPRIALTSQHLRNLLRVFRVWQPFIKVKRRIFN